MFNRDEFVNNKIIKIASKEKKSNLMEKHISSYINVF